MDKPLPEVRPGEIWEDCDWRSAGRRLKVREVIDPRGDVEPYVVCEIIAAPKTPRTVGRLTTIRRRRFKPNSTGYRKVQDAS